MFIYDGGDNLQRSTFINHMGVVDVTAFWADSTSGCGSVQLEK
jgi:hypothetical protein